MKKIIYLAPLVLLGAGTEASANQVTTHISNALRIYEQESKQNRPVGQNENEQANYQVKPTFPNSQNQLIGKGEEATHISRLDSGLINDDSSVGNDQASHVMKIGRTAIPTKQELNESKESVAGQYVQVQQNRVAQFNKGSKIYGLNNSNQLSKSNGDGYVITNAGKYNGRAVDIGVTINKVNEQQGDYTTKWSNGKKANVTGKTDASFKYQNSVLAGTQQDAITVPNKTRYRTERQTITEHWPDYYAVICKYNGAQPLVKDYYISPKLVKDVMSANKFTVEQALSKITKAYDTGGVLEDMYSKHMHHIKYRDLNGWYILPGIENGQYGYYNIDSYVGHGQICYHMMIDPTVAPKNSLWLPYVQDNNNDNVYVLVEGKTFDPKFDFSSSDYSDSEDSVKMFPITNTNDITKNPILADYDFGWGATTQPHNVTKDVDTTYHLQLANKTDANLNYDYTIGVYDAQTGDLIKDLTANYKGKAGKAATDQDTAMNDAVKAKIQAINADDADAAYTGTVANDDVTFSKNTVHVNYVDTRGESINVPGYDIDVNNLTSGNYQVPKNYALANTNGFKVTKNTHEVNGVTVTDSYNFIDQGHNKVTDNGKTLSVVLTHGTTNFDVIHSGLSNDATNNAFVINDGAKRQINSQSRHFGASGILDLVTNKITKQGDWQLSGKSNFDQVTINNNLVGYGNAIHSNLTFLAL